jgi:hypothetical protein
VAVLLSLCSHPSAAGPWAREDGAVFLSLMLSADEPRTSFATGQFTADPAASVYGELGLGRGFTAGLELDWGTSSQMGTVFARYTLTEPSAPLQVSVDAGLGQRSIDGQATDGLLRIGGSLGGSFSVADTLPLGMSMPGSGWATFDTAAFFHDDGTLSIWRAEATVGLHVSARLRAILALKAEEWPQSVVSVTARPSLVLNISEGTSLQGGLVAGLRGSDTVGVSLSIWQEF